MEPGGYVMDADVLIQAGHEGGRRNSGSGTVASVGASGIARPEREMTPIVADRAAELLEQFGVSVVRVPGVFPKRFEVKLGLCLHFDGSAVPCASGASVGYPPGRPLGSNKPTADMWKQIWGEYFPFTFMKDNFTRNLSGYYGYGRMSTSIAEMLIEFGEISCPEQDEWLQPRLTWLGDVVAFFVGRVLDVDIPKPLPFGQNEPPAPRRISVDPWDDELAVLRMELAELRLAIKELGGTIGEPGDRSELNDDHEELGPV